MGSRTPHDNELAELLSALLNSSDPVEVIGGAYTAQTDRKYIGRSRKQGWIRPIYEAVEEGAPPEQLAEIGVEDTWFLRLTHVRLTKHYPLVFFIGMISGVRGFGILDETGLEPMGFADMEIVTIDQLARDTNTERRAFVTKFVREVLLVAS